ncbi:MAG: hypothetical protein Q7U64_13585 [Desulfocapsaceae bacterium]|nr:hypothetical protein [Desulfocapsaceae bacterium]
MSRIARIIAPGYLHTKIGGLALNDPERIASKGRKGEPGQHLLYAFLPRLPKSPGAFSEAQYRFILWPLPGSSL